MVRDGLLRSRIEVTNAAILNALGRSEGEALLERVSGVSNPSVNPWCSMYWH